ncbi:MAG: type IV pilin-like G/H family protein [Microcystaceae cyanobacterium]
MRVSLNLLNSVLGIRLLFVFGVMTPLLMIPAYLNLDFPSMWDLDYRHYRYSDRHYRYSEGRSMIGALARAQQAYFVEHSGFADSFTDLEIPIGREQYYQFSIVSPVITERSRETPPRIIGVIMTAFPNSKYSQDWHNERVFPIIKATLYDTQERSFSIQTCIAKSPKVELHSIKLLSSKMQIFPYTIGVDSNQSELETNDIFPCPEGFRELK